MHSWSQVNARRTNREGSEIKDCLEHAMAEHKQVLPFSKETSGTCMVDISKRTIHKIERPAIHYGTPDDVTKDKLLSVEQRRSALNTWEQDARQLLTASNEGMPSSKEGVDDCRLGDVIRAKDRIGTLPTKGHATKRTRGWLPDSS
jgi:hypothetical protein